MLLIAERKRLADEAGRIPSEIGYSTRTVLELLTITGARSIGQEHEIGSLTPGKRADLIVVDGNAVFASPLADPAGILLFHTDASDIDTVLVAGKIRKRAGRLVDVDLADLNARTRRACTRIKDRYESLPRETLQDVWAGMF
jgi:cytosine/adenosine deaminase-related metal-dependent hydrolase